MKLFYKLFVFLLLIGPPMMSQNFAIEKEIKRIDSLIQYDDFENAQKKTTNLYNKLTNSNQRKKYQSQLLELQFRQAVIYDENEDASVESLKILLKIIDESEANSLHSLSFRTYLMIALAYEKSEHWELTNKYLNKAFEKYKAHHLEELYSTYCIRKGSYYRFVNKLDSLYYFAQQAEIYAEKYNNERDLLDSYLLMGIYNSKNKNYKKTLEYDLKILKHKKKQHQYREIALKYNNISFIYLKMEDYQKALLFSDSAYIFYKESTTLTRYYFPQIRYQIYENMGNTDSALYYFKQYHNNLLNLSAIQEKLNTKKLEEQYQSNKKEITIRNKDNQMVLIGSLLAVIGITSLLLFRKNRQINHRNKIINEQLGQLTQLLKQKQVLLSELQHRVKNNLQHVISILEIQKESVGFNNIDELIRGSQNRIHSMALLYKKLNISDNVNDVDVKTYIKELAELVKESYDNQQKNVILNINGNLSNISIEKALPLGLIIVELVSNSMKHAFGNRSIGIINIEITKIGNKNKLYFADNGDGFDFGKVNEKGLGLEIIKGLIDQLEGSIETSKESGFELTINFK